MPKPNRVRLVADDRLPPGHLTTSAFVLAFRGERLLMTKLAARGWGIPGGHIEPGETPEAALRREVLEETGCALGEVLLIGYQHLSVLCEAPPNYRYPHPDSYQLFYVAHVAATPEFEPAEGEEASERDFLSAEQLEAAHWMQEHRMLYEMALAQRERAVR